MNAPRRSLALLAFRPRATVLALFLLFSLGACGQTSYSAAEHLERAEAFVAERNLSAAIIEVKNALQQAPSNAEARRLLGLLHLDILDGTTAHAELSRALELGADPDSVRVPRMRAALLLGRAQDVLDESRLIESFPEDQVVDALALRGQALLMTGDVAGARATLESAQARFGDHADVLYGLARLEMVAGNEDEAVRRLDRLAEVDPGFAKGHELRGDLNVEAGDLGAAVAAFTAAIEAAHQPFSPRIKRAMAHIYGEDFAAASGDLDIIERHYQAHPALHFARGLIAFEQQQYAEAQIHFERTLSDNPRHMLSVYYLGAAHFAQGNMRQAESYLARFNTRYPEISDAARLLAAARASGGDTARAEGALRAVLTRNPDDIAALRMISSVHMSQGRGEEALERLRQVASLDPDSARTRAQLGMALLSQGDRQGGMSELEAAIALDPEGMASLEVALAMERIRAGENEEALEVLARIEAKSPDDPLVFNLKGAALLGLRDTAGARQAFERSIEIMPGYAPAVRNLAAMHVRQGDVAGGIAHLERGLTHDPKAVDLLLYLGSLQTRNGNLPAAGRALRRAVDADPGALPPRLALSGHHLVAAEPAEAVRVLAEVRGQFGDSPLWMRQMVQALGAAGEGEEAAGLVRRLIEDEPESVELHYALARALALTSDREALQASLERVMALDPGHTGAGIALARLHAADGALDKADAVLRPLLERQPNHAGLALLAGQVAVQGGRHSEAIEAFRRAAEADPDDPAAVTGLYQAQWSAGERAAAIATARDWADARPGDHGARYNLALLYLAAGDEDAAIREHRAVVDALPDNASALNNLAWLLRDRDADEALDLARRAAELNPDSAAILDTLGTIQLGLGRTDEGLATLERALAIDPGHPQTRLHYARGLAAAGRPGEARPLLEQLLAEQPEGVARAEIEAVLGDL